MPRRLPDTRRTTWTAILGIAVLASLQGWRVGIFPTADGIAYLDLSDAALTGRWQEFVNAYWSPLFPALIAAGRALLGASSRRDVPVLALVNAVAAMASALCFASVLQTLARQGVLQASGRAVISARIVCWSAFAAVVLRIVPVSLSTPDLLVVATQLAALAALLRLREEPRRGRFALAGGAALGAGFLAKGAMLVLAGSYLVALALLVSRVHLRRVALLVAAGFLVVAMPWIAVLSLHEGELTAGSVARLNLAWYVGGQSSQWPNPDAAGTEALPNQWVRVAGVPAIYDFSNHAIGTYPPWTDPAWWHVGLVPRPTLPHLRQVLKDSASEVWSLFGISLLVWLVLATGRGLRVRSANVRLTAALAVLAVAQLGVYWPVHLEARFLGIAWLYSWLAVITMVGEPAAEAKRALAIGVAVFAMAVYVVAPPGFGSPRELAFAAAVSAVLGAVLAHGPWRSTVMFIALTTAASVPWSASVAKGIMSGGDPVHLRDAAIARALRDAGVVDGAAVASVNASVPASWARIGRWHIAVEVARSGAPAFWRLSDAERAPLLRALTRRNVAAIVGVLDAGAPVPAGWIPVQGSTAVILPTARVPR